MAGFQFGHISTFSFKGNSVNFSIDEVAAEAARLPGNHPHVAEPLPPTKIAGDFGPEEVPDEIRRRVKEAKAALKGKLTAQGTIQRIRNDTHVMEAQVHSHPIYTKAPPPGHQGEVRPSMDEPLWKERYLTWRAELVRWIEQDARRRGLDLLCVVEHLDEAHPHIHALLVPRRTERNPRMDAKTTHPGYAAQSRRRAQARQRLTAADVPNSIPTESQPAKRSGRRRRRGSDVGRRDPVQHKEKKSRPTSREAATLEQLINQIGTRAYKAAMRGWQSHLYQELSFRHGLARVGPGLERLSRRAWWHRQTEAEAVLDKKELASTLAMVADNFAGQAKVADQERRDASAEAESLKDQVKALEMELAAANETIGRAAELPQTIQSLEAAEGNARERLTHLSAEVAEAERKLRQARNAEDAREKAERAAADAEKRRRAAEATVTSLEQREALLRADRTEIEKQAAELKRRERNLKAMLRGLAAWANGRLSAGADGKIVISRAKAGRNPDEELALLKPVEEWLVEKVRILDSMFTQRLKNALNEVKTVVATTVEAWANGLLCRDETSKSGVRIRGEASSDAAQRLLEKTSDHPDVVLSTIPLLPNLTAVHDLLGRADKLKTDLDAAELRKLNAATAKLRALGARTPDRR